MDAPDRSSAFRRPNKYPHHSPPVPLILSSGFSATDRRSMIRLGYSYCNCTFNTEITKSDAFDAARDHLTRTGPHA